MNFQSMTPEVLFKYDTIFLSDTHLFSKIAAEEYLYEFLLHAKARQIYLVGDFIGGWEKEKGKQRAATEMTKRIFALLLQKANEGTKIHYVPGNHDEKLRTEKLFSKVWKQKWLNGNFSIEEMPVFHAPGPKGERYLIGHGDEYYMHVKTPHPARRLFTALIGTPASHVGSFLYDTLIYAGKGVSDWAYQKTGYHISPVGTVKHFIKSLIDYSAPDPLADRAAEMDLDGVIFGHTHNAGESVKSKVVLAQDPNHPGVLGKRLRKKEIRKLNDGDWVESCTFLGFKADGTYEIVDYRQRREELGFGDLPEAGDPLPSALTPYMRYANILVRHVHAIWPGRDQEDILATFKESARKLIKHEATRKTLEGIMYPLGYGGFPSSDQQTFLVEALSDLKGRQQPRMDRLKRIFEEAAEDSTVSNAFLKTVVRQIGQATQRRADKQGAIATDAARRMDLRWRPRGPVFSREP